MHYAYRLGARTPKRSHFSHGDHYHVVYMFIFSAPFSASFFVLFAAGSVYCWGLPVQTPHTRSSIRLFAVCVVVLFLLMQNFSIWFDLFFSSILSACVRLQLNTHYAIRCCATMKFICKCFYLFRIYITHFLFEKWQTGHEDFRFGFLFHWWCRCCCCGASTLFLPLLTALSSFKYIIHMRNK